MKNNWATFLLAMGLFLISISIMLPNPHITILMGGFLIVMYIIYIKKKK